MSSRTGERGQVFVIWMIGSLALMTLLIFVLQLGNTLRWTIRAQNAADAAARAAIGAQTQPFNEMLMMLYATSLEEYRLRRIITGITLVANDAGGCTRYRGASGAPNRCPENFAALRIAYDKSLARYTTDVGLLQRITANMSVADQAQDAAAIVRTMTENCAANVAADCAFGYALPTALAWQPIQPPGYAVQDSYSFYNASAPQPGAGPPSPFLRPAKVEVIVCRTLPPIVPSFFGVRMAARQIIATSAVQSIAVDSEWYHPGLIVNPVTGRPFQETETPIDYTGGGVETDAVGQDWYSQSYFRSRKTVATINGSTQFYGYDDSTSNTFEGATNWWSSTLVRSFLPTDVVHAQANAVCK